MFFNETMKIKYRTKFSQMKRFMHVTNLLPKFRCCEYFWWIFFFIINRVSMRRGIRRIFSTYVLFHRSFRHWHLNLIRNPNLTLRIQILDNDRLTLHFYYLRNYLIMPFSCEWGLWTFKGSTADIGTLLNTIVEKQIFNLKIK